MVAAWCAEAAEVLGWTLNLRQRTPKRRGLAFQNSCISYHRVFTAVQYEPCIIERRSTSSIFTYGHMYVIEDQTPWSIEVQLLPEAFDSHLQESSMIHREPNKLYSRQKPLLPL